MNPARQQEIERLNSTLNKLEIEYNNASNDFQIISISNQMERISCQIENLSVNH